jgi:EmrB/QacA subfamily drug resistance transporter
VSSQQELVYRSAPGRWAIAVTVLGSGLAAIDATVVGVALPAIGRGFHASVAGLQWVVAGYSVTLSALLLLGGALGDRFGRRRVFVIGVIWFAIASAACGFAPNAPTLITGRVLQGIGGALLTPGSLAILQASFRESDRGRAIGAWSALGGVATAAGPLLGGYLVGSIGWRWVFFINLPLAGLVVLAATRHVPESRADDVTRLDAPGGVVAAAALGVLTFGLIERSPVALAVGVLGFAAFLWREARTKEPMLPLGMFRVQQFSAINALTFAVYGALGAVLWLLPVELQQVAGFSPLESGMALLPTTGLMLALAARSGQLAARIGPRLQLVSGPLVVAVGVGLLRIIGPHADYAAAVLPGVFVLGVGLVITVAPLTASVMAAAPAEHSGIASAVNNDVARTAGLVAVALLPSVTGLTGTAYLHPHVFNAGFHRSVFIAALTCAAGAALAAATVRNPGPAHRPHGRHHCALEGPPLR